MINVSTCEYISPTLVTFTKIDMIAPYRLVHTGIHTYVCAHNCDFFVGTDHDGIDCQ